MFMPNKVGELVKGAHRVRPSATLHAPLDPGGRYEDTMAVQLLDGASTMLIICHAYVPQLLGTSL